MFNNSLICPSQSHESHGIINLQCALKHTNLWPTNEVSSDMAKVGIWTRDTSPINSTESRMIVEGNRFESCIVGRRSSLLVAVEVPKILINNNSISNTQDLIIHRL